MPIYLPMNYGYTTLAMAAPRQSSYAGPCCPQGAYQVGSASERIKLGQDPGNVWRETGRAATPALTRNRWSSAGGWPRRALGCATWQGDNLLSGGGVDGAGRCAGQQSTMIRLSLRLVEVGGDCRAGAVVQRRSPKSLRAKICVNTDDCLTSFAVIVQRSCQAQLVSNPVSRRSCR